jgi:hypothetical protein
MTGDRAGYEQRPSSVDGGRFALIDGAWRHAPNPSPPRAGAPVAALTGDFEERPLSVDGAWFARVEGEWKQVGFVAPPDRPAQPIPDGYASIDGALTRIDPPADKAEAA